MEEIWKPYPLDNRYLVSNTGFVKGPKGTILKGSVSNGYYRIGLYNGKQTPKYKFVHRMVLETFCPIENSKDLVVNHKDGNRLNNSLDNLEWCTQKENVIHARDVLKVRYKTEQAHEANKRPIKMVDAETREEKIFYSIGECADFIGLARNTITYYLKNGKPHKILKKYFYYLTN